jgi:uncharacterized protein YutE (UPF0331/DUF86 family)
MTEVDAALVRRKLGRIVGNLEDLATVEGAPLERYIENRFQKKGTERLLQETVDAAVDVNLHLLRAERRPTPSDYFSTFIEAARAGILPAELAERLAPSTGLRNRLVHEYEAIDDSQVLAGAALAVREYGEYVLAIDTWLHARGL